MSPVPTLVIFDGTRWLDATGVPSAPPSNLAPTAPGAVSAIATSSTTAAVAWGAATDPDGTVVSYDVMVNGVIKLTTATLSATLSDLVGGTTYSIAVRATDNDGTTGPTSSTSLTTPSSGIGDGWPDATTTGARGTLTPLGYTTVNVAGTVIENRRVAGNIVVNAANVIIRNCEFLDDYAYFSIDASGATNLLVEDCTFLGASSCAVLDSGGGNTYRRLDIRNSPDGFKIGNGGTLEDSYIHDLTEYDPETDPHMDGIQFTGGTDITIRHNRIVMGDHATSAILMSSGTDGGGNNCLIENNYLRGGAYTIYANQAGTTNMRFLNNTFDPMWVGYGFVTNYAAGTGNAWAGNVDLDGNVVPSS